MYLGDPQALAAAGLLAADRAASLSRQAKFADPDRLADASDLFARMSGQTAKIGPALQTDPHLDPDRNRSASSRRFVEAPKWASE